MRYRPLGNTGLETSEIALGTWAFSSTSYGDVDEDSALKAIHTALDQGITLYDTAPLYGTADQDGISEIILGKGLGQRRDEVLISTKFGRNPSDGAVATFTAQRVRESVEASLQRLNTDRIDVLFFHSPFGPAEIHDDVWEGLAEVQQAGKVRVVGHSISMFDDTQQMARDWAAERKIGAIQVVYSLMNRESAALIGDLARQGVGVVARESLANGFLTGAITRDTVFPPNNLNSRYSKDELSERVGVAESYAALLVKNDIKSLAQAAMRWVLDNSGVSTVLSGAKNPAEIADCAQASDAPGYSAADLAEADRLHSRDYSAA